MTNLETQIRTAFLANASFAALVTGGFYLVRLPQNPSYPCGIFMRVATVPIYTQNLGLQAQVGKARIQFQFWSASSTAEAELNSIYQAMLAVLAGFSAYALPQSPPLANQAPNIVVNRTIGIEDQTQPQLFTMRCDVDLWYQDQ